MQMHRSILPLVLAAGVVSVAHANPVGVGKESGRTGGNAVRDSVLTFGRTTRDFFTHGPRTAKRTWNANSATTKANARRNRERVKAEADE
jgi:hypothetical protein